MNRAWYLRFDWVLLALALCISGLGFAVINSANAHQNGSGNEAAKQILFAGIGTVLLFVMAFIDYTVWRTHAKLLYVLNILLLGAVASIGHSALGAQRWISLGPLGTFQPSEPAKLIVAATTAALLARRPVNGVRSLFLPLFFLAIPALLVLKQPDLGTTLVFVAIFSAQICFAAERALPLVTYICSLLATLWITLTTNLVLRPFQRDRLLVFLHPDHDLQGTGYNLHQAEIAIGSGGLLGKGYLHGSQTQLGFVPEHSRDFIFTVVGEEFGFAGAMLLLALYLGLFIRATHAITDARDAFGAYLAAGIAAMLAFHVIVNIGMTVGIMPITGIPLPFMSYGGSAVLTDFAAVGILLNIRFQRDEVRFSTEMRKRR